MAYSALVSLAQTTHLILNPHKYSISIAEKEEITSIRKHAISLISLLETLPRKNRLEEKMRDVAAEAEDTIEDSMWDQIHASSKGVGPTGVEFERQLIRVREEISSIIGDMMDERLVDSPATAISSSSRLASTGKNDIVVGLDEELIAIKGRLCGESSKLEVIPILGMGGIGKSTLARCAFDDRLIVEHFYIRAWITISQDYSPRDILSSLLDSLKMFDKQMLAHENGITMGDEVYQCLKGRRYLIVMDDVWSTKAMDNVRNIFPDDHNGSRIMLTTRLSDVATYAVSSSFVHEMKFMAEDQCWNLLKQKVFKKGNGQGCPSELEDVGKEIARSCRGLPLAVVLIAGVLLKVVETRASWEEIAKNVNSFVGGQLEKILSLSYIHLPHHLRSCFLYLGGFPENHELRVSKLIKLWVAEGFPKQTNESKSSEEEAEEYLEDLAERSLVLVSSRKSNGKIKSCNLHDLVRDLCIRKAREEKFLVHASAGNVDARRLKITNSDTINGIIGSTYRTLLFFGTVWLDSSNLLDFFRRCKLLRVLDLPYDSSVELPYQLFELFHLRYLALRNLINVPSAISELNNLQTLIIKPKAKQSKGKIPLEIWRMPQLRHLVVYSLYLPPVSADGSFLPLEHLQTLLEVNCLVCSEEFLKMSPNVKKLGLIYNQKDDEEREHELHNLKRLYQLEKLKVTMRNFSWAGRNPAFPESLKKLTLFGGGFPWSDMIIVGSLPNLEVLKLINHACDDEHTWEMTDGGFPQLKFLLIESSTLSNWITECCPFPALERLILRLCLSLCEIPDGIVETSSLEIIEVEYGSKSLVKSAKEILEDQQSNGNYALQVRVVSKSFTVEKMSGKKCYMIGARELAIAWSDNPECWQWKACAESRFSEVAELNYVFWLDIRVKIKTQMLSSNTTYTAYLVFKLAKRCRELESANAVVRFFNSEAVGDAKDRSVVVHLQRAGGRRRIHSPIIPVKTESANANVRNVNSEDGEETSTVMHQQQQADEYDGDDEGGEIEDDEDCEDDEYCENEDVEDCESREYGDDNDGAQELNGMQRDDEDGDDENEDDDDGAQYQIRTHPVQRDDDDEDEDDDDEDCDDDEDSDDDDDDDDDDDGAQEQKGTRPVRREDGWMEVEMGNFYNDDDGGEAVARLSGIGRHGKSGLIIEGIEFRPKTQFDVLEDELPNLEHEHPLMRNQSHIISLDELSGKMGYMIGEKKLVSLEETSRKKCYMIGAKELMIVWSETPEYWQWKPCADSRFSEVAELIDVCWLDIRVIIKTQVLSMNTTYAAYLVFKLAEECYGLESASAVVRFVSSEVAEETAIVVHLQQLADNDECQEQNERYSVWRNDGWMEVELGSFYNDDDYDDGEAEARLLGFDGEWKSGLIIEGIEFRPKP